MGERPASKMNVAEITRHSTSKRKLSMEEHRRLVSDSLNIANPVALKSELPVQPDPQYECQIELRVDAIRTYEHNPRRANNAKFDDIKESIRTAGVRNPLTVTRRPGESHFIVEAGGNTRLLATQQLWQETGDPRFENISVVFRPWVSEAHVLSAHLVENEQRGDMTFWDKANAVFALKALLENESGCAFTLRQLEEALKRIGLATSRSALSRYQFACQSLSLLGDAAAILAEPDIRKIQPHFNLLRRYAHKHSQIAEEQLYADVLNPTLLRHGGRFAETGAFDSEQLCRECEQSLAQYTGQSAEQLHLALDAMHKSPELPQEAVKPVSDSPQAAHGFGISDESQGAADEQGTQHTKAARRASMPSFEAPVMEKEICADQVPSENATLIARSPAEDLLNRIEHTVTQFARLCDIADCLHSSPDMPSGFYVELPSAPLDMGNPNPLRHPGWWLLALISKQMDESLNHRLPPDSRWRRVHRGEAQEVDDNGLALLIETHLLGPISPSYLADWLLDPANEPAALYLSALRMIRELWRVAPQRFIAAAIETTS